MAALSFTAISSSCLSRLPGLVLKPCTSLRSPALREQLLGFRRSRAGPFVAAAPDGDRHGFTSTAHPQTEDILSGEWPDNFALLNYEDLCKHYEPVVLKEEAQPHTLLADVMSSLRYSATPEKLLEEIDHCFLDVSGVPVVNKELKCIGVMSKKDKARASKGLQSTVGEVMSSPPIVLSADKTVNDAAILMLKNKIHRIPIVNEAYQVVGMVTRTDIFKALEAECHVQ